MLHVSITMGMYYPSMQSLGQTGVVQHIDAVGDARVSVKDRTWWFNSECLSMVAKDSEDATEQTQPGVCVCVLYMCTFVGGGGSLYDITNSVYGCIIFIGQTQILGENIVDLRRRMELLKTIGDSDVLAHAALLGEEEVIREYLDEYPNDVSQALSLACTVE